MRRGWGWKGLGTFSTGQPGTLSWNSGSIHGSTNLSVCLPCAWHCGHVSSLRPHLEFTGAAGTMPTQQLVGLPFIPGTPLWHSAGHLIWEKHSTSKGQVFKSLKNAAASTFIQIHFYLFVLLRNFWGLMPVLLMCLPPKTISKDI